MMRSLFSGVAGLKTHQTKMDVIGNNIANVNTVAYKTSSIVFADLMSQTTQRASGPNATTGTGGINARQIGLGVKSGAININITGQGSSQSTGNPFDVMIEGENFFVVNNGNLAMTSTGYNVMGWQFDEETNAVRKDTVSALRIMSAANMTYPPEATTQGNMSGIIDKLDPDVASINGRAVNMQFYDSLGYSYTAKFVFKQSDDVHEYSVELVKIENSAGEEIDLSPNPNRVGDVNNFALFGNSARQEKAGKVSFNSKDYHWDTTGKILYRKGTAGDVQVANLGDIVNGNALKGSNEWIDQTDHSKGTVQDQLDAIAKAYGYEGSTEDFLNLVCTVSNNDPTAATPNPTETQVSIRQMIVNANTSINNYPTEPTQNFTSLPTFITPAGGTAPEDTSFATSGRDFVGVRVNYDPAKGRRLGKMIGVAIETNGRIIASYDSGVTKCLGQIATANFANASGLEKMGDNMYAATLNSGEFDGIGVDITAGGGKMSTGQLEMSNVDLSSEFTEMITTQRGFQANSRIITVSDSLLEELTNLKR